MLEELLGRLHPKLLVVDVSNAQGQVDWQQVAAAGVHGALLKATEGVTFADAFFHANRAGAAAARVHAGAYHFARPDRNAPEDEARHFLAVVGTLHPFELRPALDLEVPGHVGADGPADWARRFCQTVHEHAKVWPIFYSYRSFITAMAPPAPIGDGLWLASYGRNTGLDEPGSGEPPKPWRHVLLHQFTSRGHLAGVRGLVDLSHCSRLPLVG